MDPDVPVVVAEVNPEDLSHLPKGIASCPNCTTAIPVTALAPLHRAARIERMVVSTYQSVSGAGQSGLHELDSQWKKLADRTDALWRAGTLGAPVIESEVWAKPIAGNVIPLSGSVKEEGYTSEEWKMVREARKILHDPEIRATVTCVRVPVYVGPRQRERPLPPSDGQGRSRRTLGRRAGSCWSTGRRLPTPSKAPASTRCWSVAPARTVRAGSLNLWVTGDNLRKGAALNAVQLAEILVARSS
jgi:aspartate-semialdehyde dehydrogenase